MKKELVERLLNEDLPSIEEIEAKYPNRVLPEGALVTRVGPSPTGFMHVGTIYVAMMNKKLAKQSGGAFFLRIEDTDGKREVEGAKEIINKYLKEYGILEDTDEGPLVGGDYAPYIQSERGPIYRAYIKHMLENDLAYPCFCSSEQLDEMRASQKKDDVRTGYYGHYARCRRLSEEDIESRLDEGLPFVIRFKSSGRHSNKILVEDLIRGKRNLSENDFDTVIMKSDRLPTYHFAHLIDDHLMGCNLVLRADEWISSLPLHIQLFEAMGWEAPKYAHLAPIEKMEDGSRRKLSKRKDPEAGANYYDEVGYPHVAILEYLYNLANSDFEPWRRKNPTTSIDEFELKINKLSKSGCLFDFDKLDNISQNYISRLTKNEVFDELYKWASTYNTTLKEKMDSSKEYILDILNIERENTNKPRKDIIKWSTAWETIAYFFDDEFALTRDEALSLIFNSPLGGESKKASESEARLGEGSKEILDIKAIVKEFMTNYDENIKLDQSEWFNSLKEIADKHGYCTNGKEYKANPDAYKGNMAAFAKIFRVLLRGQEQSPDLYSMMNVMGKDMVARRLNLI